MPTRDIEAEELEFHGAVVEMVDIGELREITVAVRMSPLSDSLEPSSNGRGTERRA